jgi:hypothetical protein
MPMILAKDSEIGELHAMPANKNAGELKRLVEECTGYRVRDVFVELDRDQIVLRGRTPSFHVKQLAQEGIFAVMPGIPLVNAMEVCN